MATIKDVAGRAGVSIGTVDRVLNDRGRVAPETLRRVRQAIHDLNYSPNLTARHLSMAKTYTFGVMMPDVTHDNGYWALPQGGVARAAQDLAFHNVSARYFFFNQYSSDSFNECSRQVLEAGLDGLVLAPVLSRPARHFLETISTEHSFPVVLFDCHVETSAPCTFVGQDPFTSGLVAGKLLRILSRGGTTQVVVTVGTDDYHLARRAEGFHRFFESDPTVRIRSIELDREAGNNPSDDLSGKMPGDLSDVSGIFVTNALCHLVVTYLESRGVPRHIPLVAYDLIPENVEYLREGRIDFAISQEPETQGYHALYELYRQVVLGSPPSGMIPMPIELVTRENLDSYLQARADTA
ncbi:MAG: LacI family transcriptional regulator [Spirochaetaceae bacterium]|nr:MAG: LacI family transcriptional regulator [Spirochaetaceae bacterium]